MPTPDNWLSLEFWTKSTEGLNHLALIVGGAIGIVLLAIRTFAANRSANASLEQAKAANQSAATALEQAKTALKQAETASERHEAQTKADKERRITESFAKAAELLGSDKRETCLGGIYTLERIAGESPREYWPIMETLTGFVRERVPWRPQQSPAEQPKNWLEQPPPPTDIQAVLTVLGRRNKTAPEQYSEEEAENRHLDLAGTDLRGARLAGAHLEWTRFGGAHLERARLRGAHLEDTDLWCAHLEGAWLSEAHLKRAYLMGAQLEGAWLDGAHFEGADLMGADGLTQEQLESAFGDYVTTIPKPLTRPERWSG